ncbi:MAG: hypothetical protein AAGH88_04995 [Planctomycetota bacterium]
MKKLALITALAVTSVFTTAASAQTQTPGAVAGAQAVVIDAENSQCAQRTFYSFASEARWVNRMRCNGWQVTGRVPHYNNCGQLVAVTVWMARY